MKDLFKRMWLHRKKKDWPELGLLGPFLEAWEVIVDKDLYKKACKKNKKAIQELEEQLHGLELYTHYFCHIDNGIKVTFVDLVNIGVVKDICTRKQCIVLITKVYETPGGGAIPIPDLDICFKDIEND